MFDCVTRLIVVLSLFLFGCTSLAAQGVCLVREELIKRLSSSYGEEVFAIGLAGELSLYEIWVSDDTGTWTIVRHTPNGFACIVVSGTNWHTAVKISEPEGEDG